MAFKQNQRLRYCASASEKGANLEKPVKVVVSLPLCRTWVRGVPGSAECATSIAQTSTSQRRPSSPSRGLGHGVQPQHSTNGQPCSTLSPFHFRARDNYGSKFSSRIFGRKGVLTGSIAIRRNYSMAILLNFLEEEV